MKADAKPILLEEIAALVSHPSAPLACVVPCLQSFVPLVSSRLPENDDIERKLFNHADFLQRWLPMYARVEKQFGIEAPHWLEDLMQALEEAMPFLAAQVARVRRKGGPTPDISRELCAEVCLGIWRRLHNGASQGYSNRLWQACEDYWQACDWPPTSTKGRLKNWEPFLVRVRKLPDDDVEAIIDKFFRAPATTP